MANKKKRPLTKLEKKLRRRIVWNRILIIILLVGILGVACGSAAIYTIIKSCSITLDVTDFKSTETTTIFDRNGEEIARVGVENRINITYDQIPQVVIDAFVAVEDSRYFEHAGFDIPRFAKSAIVNVLTRSIAQGGSTLTMQMVKNTYFVTDEALAPNTVDRKVQEIYLAMQAEKIISKKKIFELYINKINFGGSTRGIQTGAKYYFNKDVSELTLNEAAILAGVIIGPNLYNPYYNVDYCESRRWEVLYQMVNHGYITQEEMDACLAIPIQNLLSGQSRGYGENTTTDLQSYIDQVLNEIEEITGEDPYTTPMRVYTAMDPAAQKAADEICQGKTIDYLGDDYFQVGFAVVNNHTGEIVALGGGRGRTGERTFSFATDTMASPGSSIKPILDYALAFNYAGVSTADEEYDKPTKWEWTDIEFHNAGGREFGMLNIYDCLARSLNIPAIKLLRKARAAMGENNEKMVINYMKAIGFDSWVADNFAEQYGIGGASMMASPLQMAGAQAMLLNSGIYIEPHCITRIEYLDSSLEPYTPDYQGIQVITPQAAYLTCDLLKNNVDHHEWLPNVGEVERWYPVYSKTGSSNWDSDAAAALGVPNGSMRDHWQNTSTEQFTVAVWTGYESASKDHRSYFSDAASNYNYAGKIGGIMIDTLAESYGVPSNGVTRPSGLSSVTFVKGSWPYITPPSYCPKEMIVTGIAYNPKTVSWKDPSIEQMTGLEAYVLEQSTKYNKEGTSSTTNLTVSVKWPAYPVAYDKVFTKQELEGGTDGIPSNPNKEAVVGKLINVAEIYLDGELVETLNADTFEKKSTKDSTKEATLTFSNLTPGDHVITVNGFYQFSNAKIQCDPVIDTATFFVQEGPKPEPIPTPEPVDPTVPE
ncbi:MAG: transglycosylase domain-containing protein [Erysipelotrichales bacterium]|nr:transglycosylase domain-containing protein [Erysipelotrichales bacterium]